MTTQTRAEPVLAARVERLGVRALGHWVFRHVEASIPARGVAAVVGAAGSGRTTLLLALAGRMRLTTGSVTLGDSRLTPESGGRELRAYRTKVAVARIADHVGLDGELTLRHNARDAADWAKVDRRRALVDLEEWWDRLGFELDLEARVSELPVVEARAAHLVLATLGEPALIVADDLTSDLQVDERRRIWEIAREVAASGPAIVASTLDELTLDADVVVRVARELPRHVTGGPELDEPEPEPELDEPEPEGPHADPGPADPAESRPASREENQP